MWSSLAPTTFLTVLAVNLVVDIVSLHYSSAATMVICQRFSVKQAAPAYEQVSDDLNPMRVLSLFRAISARDAELLDMAGRPEDLLVTALAVPPVVIRPSVEMDTGAGSNEDDCTMRLMVSLYALFCCHDLKNSAPVSSGRLQLATPPRYNAVRHGLRMCACFHDFAPVMLLNPILILL